MIKIIGVRFRNAGKIYYFDPKKLPIKKGDHVIVETARGIEYGSVVADAREVTDDQVVQPLKPVIRIANADDNARAQRNKEKEKEAFRICLEKIRKHKLEMKLIDTEYTFDNNKVLFYFTADGRIDFRELVKDLASVFKTRIELRQIGVRDETKVVGGVGICGRELCCHTFLSEFAPVSIKMAKEQNLSLNPTKISGVCGRLMCCLKNEEDTYEYLNSRLPGIGDRVIADDGLKGEVQSVNVLRQLVKVLVDVQDEKELREYKVEANVGAPQVAYKETIRKAVDQDTKYARQSGGKGQYGHVKIHVEPNESGKGYEFINKVVGGAIPKEYIPAIDAGIQGAMLSGTVAGYPVVDVKVTLYDGSYHEVDSSEMAFKIAGSMAFKEAMRKADPTLLEPIMKVSVIVPEEYMGDVIGDISARRGQIQGYEMRAGAQQIDAFVPLAEMFGYATDLRSRTQGRGQYTMEPSHYIELPKGLQEKLINKRTGRENF